MGIRRVTAYYLFMRNKSSLWQPGTSRATHGFEKKIGCLSLRHDLKILARLLRMAYYSAIFFGHGPCKISSLLSPFFLGELFWQHWFGPTEPLASSKILPLIKNESAKLVTGLRPEFKLLIDLVRTLLCMSLSLSLSLIQSPFLSSLSSKGVRRVCSRCTRVIFLLI